MERVCPMESLNQLFIRLLKFLISNDYFNIRFISYARFFYFGSVFNIICEKNFTLKVIALLCFYFFYYFQFMISLFISLSS